MHRLSTTAHLRASQLVSYKALIPILFLSLSSVVFGQRLNCDTNLVVGQDLIVNGGFEDGDTGFNIPNYYSWNASGPASEGYSSAGQYLVGDDPNDFNPGAFFGSPQTGDNFLMLDGECIAGNVVWEQEVYITSNTRYFFSVGITSIHPLAPAELSFEIDGQLLPEQIIAPAQTGVWVDYVDSSWFSGSSEGLVMIRIRNSQTLNCNNGNDFGLDNVRFLAGCGFGSDGEVPNLGEDLSFCGTDGTITLDPNVLGGSNVYEFTWSTEDTTETIEITKNGSYAVCISTNGSCVKSDVIKITSLYDIDLGDDKEVCKEITDTLIAEHSGPLVTYQWYRNGIPLSGENDSIYVPTSLGDYSVVVFDDASKCGEETDEITISKGTVTIDLGDDVELCKPATATLDAIYEGIGYEWYFEGVRMGDQTGRIAEVNQVGSYEVIVSDALCDDATAQIDVTSKTFTAVNGGICPEDGKPDSTILSVTNFTGDPNNLEWYDAPTGGNLVGTGLTFQTSGLSQTTTYYVEDIGVFQTSVGPNPLITSSSSGYNTESNPGNYIEFEVLSNIVIDSLLVYPMWTSPTYQVGVTIRDLTTDALVQQVITPLSFPTNGDGDPSSFPSYVAVNISLPPGTYKITNEGTANGGLYFSTDEFPTSFPYTEPQGVIRLTAHAPNYQNQLWSYFYDWHISSGAVCDRVPVSAIFDPLACGACVSPTVSTLSTADSTICLGDSTLLIADVAPDTSDYKFTWYLNGSPLTDGDTSSLYATQPGIYSYLAADSVYPALCFANSTNEIIVEVDEPPYGEANITGAENAICTGETIQLTANAIGGDATTYTWFENGLEIANTDSFYVAAYSSETDIKVTIDMTGLACIGTGSATDSVTVTITPSEIPTISLTGPSEEVCPNDEFQVDVSTTPSEDAIRWYVNNTLDANTSSTLSTGITDTSWIKVEADFTGLTCTNDTTVIDSIEIKTLDSVLPEVTISVDQNDICETELPLTFTITSPINGGSTPTYQWLVDGIAVTGETNTTFSSSTLTNGAQVSVEMTSSLACVQQSTVGSNVINAVITNTTNVNLNATPDETVYCEGEEITINATSTGAGVYSWLINGELIINSTAIFVNDTLVSTDEVTVQFVSDDKCPDQATSTFDLGDLNIVPTNVTIVKTHEEWCTGKTQGYEVIDSTNGGNDPLFTWYVNGAEQFGQNDPTFTSSTLEENDVVIVVMESSDPDCPIPADDTKTVGFFNTPDTTQFNLPDITWCISENYSFVPQIAFLDTATSNYIWTLDGVLINQSDSIVSFDELELGEHELIGTVTTSTFCVTEATLTDTAIITLLSYPIAEAGDDITLTDFEEFTLDGTGSTESNVTYIWATDDLDILIGSPTSITAQSTPIEQSTVFYLGVSNGVCSAIDSVVVTVNIDLITDFPNAFSPNGDGDNDVFEIDHLDQFPDFKLEIYNRWGNLLYTQTDPASFWDGRNNGKDMPVATYYFIFVSGREGDDTIKGSLTLIR